MDNTTSLIAGAGILIIVFILIYAIILLVSIAFAVLGIIAQWKLFVKAGEPGWKVLIPFYNFLMISKIATGNFTAGWAFIASWALYFISNFAFTLMSNFTDSAILVIFPLLLMLVILIPFVGIKGYLMFMFSKSFGKSTAWNVLMIFFSPIMMIIMGFDKNLTYVGPKGIKQY